MPSGVDIRALDASRDRAWAEALLGAELGGRLQARRGELMDPLEGAGLVAELRGQLVGLVTWAVAGPFSGPRDGEIRVLVVARAARRGGIGSALLSAAREAMARAGAERAWLVTTNDNLEALRFYQRRGWRLATLNAGAVDEARRTLKPAIGSIGNDGIPIRDELILTLELPTSGYGHLG